jgi:phospholipid/cholesterol/gamma-HCH transport system permease protein
MDVNQEPLLSRTERGDRVELTAAGPWTAVHAEAADRLVAAIEPTVRRATIVDVAGVTALDTFGAWLLERLARGAMASGAEGEIVGVPERFRGLFEKVHEANREGLGVRPAPGVAARATAATERLLASLQADATSFLSVLGALGLALARVAVRPRTFRLTSAVHHLDRVAWQAIPIILLITFLIGGIIAQQGIFHFRRFGADDYVVDLVGILVLREIGVLIVAIMVAGRSGSSYTAELGSMKMREEIDALRTMGLDPVEILILPRVVALVIGLPALAFLGSMAALYGGEVVAWIYGGMSPAVFLARLKDAISVTHFEVGMWKAPFMALVIGVVACAEGLRVEGSAESLGLKTTTSVVKSIFLVIVLDGIFAVFFASIGM